MPSWFHEQHMDILEEEVASKKRRIDRGEIPQESIPIVMNEIKAKEKKIKEIKSAIPKLNGKEKDNVAKTYNLLRNRIAETLPSRRDVNNGFVRPYDELNRCKEPIIEVDRELAAACNVKVVNGKVSGDGANKMYMMLGRALGEDTNVEKLRRDGRDESYKTMDDMTKKILEKIGA